MSTLTKHNKHTRVLVSYIAIICMSMAIEVVSAQGELNSGGSNKGNIKSHGISHSKQECTRRGSLRQLYIVVFKH